MSQKTFEQRLATLESQMGDLRGLLTGQAKDWRSMIGCFADDPGMMEIFEEGRKIRERDRKRAKRPNVGRKRAVR